MKPIRKNASLLTVAKAAVALSNKWHRKHSEALFEMMNARKSDRPETRAEAYKAYGYYDNKCREAGEVWAEHHTLALALAKVVKGCPLPLPESRES